MRILNGNKRVIPSAGTISYWDSVTNDGGIIKSVAATQDALDMLSGYSAWMIDPHYSGYRLTLQAAVNKLYSIGNNTPLLQGGAEINKPIIGNFVGRKSIMSNKRFAATDSDSGGYAFANISPTITSSYNILETGFAVDTASILATDFAGGNFSVAMAIASRVLIRFNAPNTIPVGPTLLLFVQGFNGVGITTIINKSINAPTDFYKQPVYYFKLTINYTTLAYTFESSIDNNIFTVLDSGTITNAFRTQISVAAINADSQSPIGGCVCNTLYSYLKIDGTTIYTFNPYDCLPNATSWTDAQGRSWSLTNHVNNNPVAGFIDKRNSLFLNGKQQFLASASADPFFTFAGDFLISATMKPSLWDSSNSRMALLSTASDSSATTGFMLEFGSADGFRLLNNGSTVLDDSTSSITGLTPKINHYVRIQRQGTGSNNLQIYVDDVLRGQASYNGVIGASNVLYVGANSAAQAGVLGFCGEIPSICVINGTWDATIADKLRTIQTRHYQAV